MTAEFKVVQMSDLFQWPSERPAKHEAAFAERLEAALNKMAAAGWIYVGTSDHASVGYATFRRDAQNPGHSPAYTGFP